MKTFTYKFTEKISVIRKIMGKLTYNVLALRRHRNHYMEGWLLNFFLYIYKN